MDVKIMVVPMTLLASLAMAYAANASDYPHTVKAYEAKYAWQVTVDGNLSEWAESEFRDDFRQVEDGTGTTVGRFAIAVRRGSQLFVAFRARGASRCLSDRTPAQESDVFDGNDVVELFFKTGGANGYTQLAVATTGGRYDSRDGDGFVNLDWESAVRREPDGSWSAELAIPYSTLGYDPAVEWGFRMNAGLSLPAEFGGPVVWSGSGNELSSAADMAFVAYDSFARAQEYFANDYRSRTGEDLPAYGTDVVDEVSFRGFLNHCEESGRSYSERIAERARKLIAEHEDLPGVVVGTWNRDADTFLADGNYQMGLLERVVSSGVDVPSFEFRAARNERVHADFTLSAVREDQTLSIAFSDLVAPNGRRIPASQLYATRAKFLNQPSDFDATINQNPVWPELIERLDGPDALKKLESGLYRAYVATPNVSPGRYEGEMTVTWGDGTAHCPISLEVLPITLPTEASQPINSYIFTTIPFAGKSGDAWGRFFREHYLTDVQFEHPEHAVYRDGVILEPPVYEGEGWDGYVKGMCEYKTPPGAKVVFDFDRFDIGERIRVCAKYNLRIEMCNRNGFIFADHLPMLAKEMEDRFGLPQENFVYKLGDEDQDAKFLPVAQHIRELAPRIQTAMIPAGNDYWDIAVLSNGFTEITYSRAAYRGGERGERDIELLRQAGVRVKRYRNDASWAARTIPIHARWEPNDILVDQELDGYCCWTGCCWPPVNYSAGYSTNIKYDFRVTPPESQWIAQLVYVRPMGDWYKPVSCQRLEDIRDGFIDVLYWREARKIADRLYGEDGREILMKRKEAATRQMDGRHFATYDAGRRALADFIIENRNVKRIVHTPARALSQATANPFVDEHGGTWECVRMAAANSRPKGWKTLDAVYATDDGFRGFARAANETPMVAASGSGADAEKSDGWGVFRADEVCLFPGCLLPAEAQGADGWPRVALVFTVPRSGWYSLKARFRETDPTVDPYGRTTADVSIALDGALLYQEVIDRAVSLEAPAYSFERRFLVKGSRLAFVVGSGFKEENERAYWAYANDATALGLEIVEEETVAEADVLGVADLGKTVLTLPADTPKTFEDVSGLGTWTIHQMSEKAASPEYAPATLVNYQQGSLLGGNVLFGYKSTLDVCSDAAGCRYGAYNSGTLAPVRGYKPYDTIADGETVVKTGSPTDSSYGNVCSVGVQFVPKEAGTYLVTLHARDAALGPDTSDHEGVVCRLFVGDSELYRQKVSAEREDFPERISVQTRPRKLIRGAAPEAYDQIELVIEPDTGEWFDQTGIFLQVVRLADSCVTSWDVGMALTEMANSHANPQASQGASWSFGGRLIAGDGLGEFTPVTRNFGSVNGYYQGLCGHTAEVDYEGPFIAGNALGWRKTGLSTMGGAWCAVNAREFYVIPKDGHVSGIIRFAAPSDGVYAVDAGCRDAESDPDPQDPSVSGVNCFVMCNDNFAACDVAVGGLGPALSKNALLSPGRLYLKAGETLDLGVDMGMQLSNDSTFGTGLISTESLKDVVSVDFVCGSGRFSGRGRVGFSDSWNVLAVTSGGTDPASARRLSNDTNEATRVSVTLTPPAGGAMATVSGQAGVKGLLVDGVSSADGSAVYAWEVSGLVRNAPYTLYLYGTGGATFSVGGKTGIGLTDNWFLVPWEAVTKEVVAVTAFADEAGRIAGTFSGSAETPGVFCGLQVEGDYFKPASGMVVILK